MHRLSISFLFLICLSIIGCKQAQVDSLVERNEEVNEYFTTLDELVDEYCDMIEASIDYAKDIEVKEKDGEEASIFEGLEMFSDIAGSAFKIIKLAEKIEGMEDQHKKFENNLSSHDFEEFMNIYINAIKRFVAIAEKAESLDKK
tara:strand:- start:838 stop:1272 length:435 start_codon:yes stop_codon:yes gene_type:complete